MTRRSNGFFKDLVTEENKVVIHRLQFVIVTLVFLLLFVYRSVREVVPPDFSPYELALIAFSTCAYLLTRFIKLQQIGPEAIELALDDPTGQFLEDLQAAQRFKIFCLSNGVQLGSSVLESLARLTLRYLGPPSGTHRTNKGAPVSIEDRIALDLAIQELAAATLTTHTLEEFRVQQSPALTTATLQVRRLVLGASAVFLGLAFATLVAQQWTSDHPAVIALTVAVWSLALGGLGAVANAFLHVLNLVSERNLDSADVFAVGGRIVLACLFSVALTPTLALPIRDFFRAMHSSGSLDVPQSLLILLPFLFGYSIPLVLRILDKLIEAVEVLIGADERPKATRRKALGATPGLEPSSKA